jgi:hypothetical protein
MVPRTGRQTPTNARASELFPDPLGPMTPRALPAINVKLTSYSAAAPLPGGTSVTAVSLRLRAGAGSAMRSSSTGTALKASDRRSQLWRAVTKDFQLAIASSIGASARADRIVAASMTPAVASWLITR